MGVLRKIEMDLVPAGRRINQKSYYESRKPKAKNKRTMKDAQIAMLPDDLIKQIKSKSMQNFKDEVIAANALYETEMMKKAVALFIACGIEHTIKDDYNNNTRWLRDELARDPTIFLNSLKLWSCNGVNFEYEAGEYQYESGEFLSIPRNKMLYEKIVADITQYYANDDDFANIANFRDCEEQFSHLYALMYFDECVIDALRIYVKDAGNKFKPKYVKVLKQAYFGHFGS